MDENNRIEHFCAAADNEKILRLITDSTRGYGLFSIRESLKTLGGRLAVESKPGQGTRVFLGAPLKNK